MQLWTILVPLTLVSAIVNAGTDVSIDQYFSLRRQYRATSSQISQVASNPSAYRGKIVELRGSIAGAARTTTGSASIIISCGDGSYVVSSSEVPEISSGTRICALVQVGDSCTASLFDLRLVALTYESRVAERERQAVEAEIAKKAREATARQRQLDEQKRRQLAAQRARTYYARRRAAEPVNVTQLVAVYRNAIKSFNRRLSDSDADTIARSILGFSAQYKVDPRLVMAVILAESHFRPEATSGKGAMGLGQLMPGTAAGLGVNNAYDPVSNVKGSVRLIKGHLDRLTGHSEWSQLDWHDLSLALASYNAGPGAVRKYGGVPPYRETQAYVKRVIYYYKKLCGVS